MKTIFENASHKAATVQLNELTGAHAAARAEESLLLAQLAAPAGQPSALARANALLAGATAPARQDRSGLNQRLAEVRDRLALLTEAIEEQRAALAALASTESCGVNADAKPQHIDAARGILAALGQLREALQAEQAIRAAIVAGGYGCSLEPLERPELNPADPQSELRRFADDVNAYLAQAELTGKKSVNVRLLVDKPEGRAGDVLTMTGQQAAALVSMGHGEATNDKPSRVPRQVATGEVVLS